MEKMIFDFDPSKCTACQACVMACFDQNDIDAEHRQHPFRNAAALESVENGREKFAFLSVACMHCEEAPCVMGCPSACLYKDEESGLTLYDNTNCVGCHSCAMACPFGAPSFNREGKMEKCDGCVERLRRGMVPACVRVCPTGALTCRPASEYHEAQTARSLNMLAKHLLEEGGGGSHTE